jgi:glycosyl transferase family 25
MAKKIISSMHIEYINLKERSDRKSQIESELHRLNIKNYLRFEAIKATPGALGCALSHLEIFKNAPRNKPLFVLEDDCEFLIDEDRLDHLVTYFLTSKADVFCLAYNIPNKAIQNLIRQIRYNFFKPSIWKFLLGPLKRSAKIQTTSCYILKPHMIQILEDLARTSVEELSNGAPAHQSAIDQKWKSLQKKYVFVIPKRRAAKQRASFSDIEIEYKDYGI